MATNPSAPFVTVTIYSESPEESTLAHVAAVLDGLGTAVPGTGRFRLPSFGPARCECATSWSARDRRAIAVNLSAEELGMPAEFWSKQQMSSAFRRVKFTRELLRLMATAPGVLYGTVDSEQSVPTPSALPSMLLPVELFVANSVLFEGVRSELDGLYGQAGGISSDWGNGMFYTPFPDARALARRGRDTRNLAVAVTAIVCRACRLATGRWNGGT
ncbi:hypothetical protein [Nocardia sp. NPDC058705]|uniref:hypothetical protein n=1 Tax=Nocardia sp. NPDC058705 TaxID=3346609 RepID=UPI0036A28883